MPSLAKALLARDNAWKAQIAVQILNEMVGTSSAMSSPVKASGLEAMPERLAEMPPASARDFRVTKAGA